ncbi:MAG: Wzt carbohydrate-binding domain-containing protein, partial [Casimicrobiaceae bacterium]
ISQARAEFERYQCVSGHLFYHPRTDLSDLWSLTVLRNPIDRILSHLVFSRYDIIPTGDEFNQRTRALSIEAYIASEDPEVVRTISNVMVGHFAPLAWNGVDDLTPERSLELAKAALERFDLVGLTERMDETADVLCRALGFAPVREVPRMNASSRRIGSHDLPADTRTRLRQLNELDIELYAHARKLYDRGRRRSLFGGSGATGGTPSADDDPAPSRSIAREPALARAVAAPVETPVQRQPVNFGSREVELIRLDMHGQTGLGTTLLAGEMATVRIVFRSHQAVDDLTVGFYIIDHAGRLVFATNTRCFGHALAMPAETEGHVVFTFRADLGIGRYRVGASCHPSGSHLPKCYHWVDDLGRFEVVGNMGLHFEGMVKLNPELELSGTVPRPATPEDMEAGIQHLARLAPILREINGRLSVADPITSLLTGELVAKQVEIVNLGSERWASIGERCVRVSYHWLRADGSIARFDGDRTPLDRDLQPGESTRLWVSVRAPDTPGEYVLQLSLVQEAVAWMEELGGQTLDMRVTVSA